MLFSLCRPKKERLIFLFADDDIILVLINTVFGDDTTNAACGVNACASAEDRAGVKNAVAAYLDTVAEDSADLFALCLDLALARFDDDKGLVAFDIARYRASAHVRLVAEHGIADVIIMRRLDIVEKYRVFYLGRVADDGVFANDGAASYECAVAHLGAVIDDAGAADVCRRKNRCILCDPYIFAALLKLILGQGIAKLDDEKKKEN